MNKITLILLFPYILFANLEYTINNSNISIYQSSIIDKDNSFIYNYNRFRMQVDYKQDNFFFTIIGDVINYYGKDYTNSLDFKLFQTINSDTPFNTQSDFNNYSNGSSYGKLYRAYGGYQDESNLLQIGVQNISMGVGRIWTPSNIFNAKNSYSLEPDEIFGVWAISYIRYLTDTSSFNFIASKREDDSFKFATRYKSFIGFADFAINIIKSNNTDMISYEIEGNLGDSGVEVRSEGAYFKTEDFYQFIIGADYGFKDGLILTTEVLYNSKKFSYNELLLNFNSEVNLAQSHLYTAVSLSYNFNLVTSGGLLYIESFNDINSRFLSSSITYSPDDYSTFTFGALLYLGDEGSEFGKIGDSYYLKYNLSF